MPKLVRVGKLMNPSGSGATLLPAAGPFSGLTPKLITSVPNLTVSSSSSIPTSRRATPLEYNTLTINAGVTWSVQAADMCLFTRGNRLVCNGIISINGFTAPSPGGNDGGPGGAGSSGGGGGGGGFQGIGSCCNLGGGFGGTPGNGANGGDGVDSTVCCSPYGLHGIGGVGKGLLNWGLVADGGPDTYNYAAALQTGLGLDINGGKPWGLGGQGGMGDESGGGGGGGGAAGIGIIEYHSATFGAAAIVRANGGGLALNGSGGSLVDQTDGDGGALAFIFTHYDGTLSAKHQVTGNVDGLAKIFQRRADNTLAEKAYTDIW